MSLDTVCRLYEVGRQKLAEEGDDDDQVTRAEKFYFGFGPNITKDRVNGDGSVSSSRYLDLSLLTGPCSSLGKIIRKQEVEVSAVSC